MGLVALLLVTLPLQAETEAGGGALLTVGSPQLAEPGLGPPDLLPDSARPTLRDALAAGRLDEALEQARERLRAVAERHGAGHRAAIPARVNLAIVHHRRGEHEQAAGLFAEAVRFIEAEGGSRDPRLIPALHGMAAAALATGRTEQAIAPLQRAAFIARAHHGLHSVAQLRYVDPLLEAYLTVGQKEAATARQQARLSILAQAEGTGSEAHLEALRQAGRFYRRLGDLEAERRVHETRRDILSDRYGRRHPSVAPVLRDIAQTYRLSQNPDIMGLQALQEANHILDRAEDVPVVAKARMLAEEGDHYQAFGVWASAISHYRRAWKMLDEAGETRALEALFGRPFPVHVPAIAGAQNASSIVPQAEGYVVLEVDITQRGSVRRTRRVATQPPDLADEVASEVASAVRRARFRPRIGEKGSMESQGFRLRYRFHYPAPQAAVAASG